MHCLYTCIVYIHVLSIYMHCLYTCIVYIHALSIYMHCLYTCIVYIHALSIYMHCLYTCIVYIHALSIYMHCLYTCINDNFNRISILFFIYNVKQTISHCQKNYKIQLKNCTKEVTMISPTEIHDLSHPWLGRGTSITKSVGVKLVLWEPNLSS